MDRHLDELISPDETKALVTSFLKARGQTGATTGELERICAWAVDIRTGEAENDPLDWTEAGQRAALAAILRGEVLVDVRDGEILFAAVPKDAAGS